MTIGANIGFYALIGVGNAAIFWHLGVRTDKAPPFK
jgi:hypothetical protein